MNIRHEISEYKSHLSALDFAQETIKRYGSMLEYFLRWDKELNLVDIEYTQLLEYIRHLQEAGKSKSRINKYLLAVRHYLDLKTEQEIIEKNPAIGVQLRAKQHSIIHGIITKEEQETIWKSYQGKHKLMLSLVLHQALTIKEIERIEIDHIDLENGTMYIAGGRKHNGRTLQLRASQIVLILGSMQNNKRWLFGKRAQHNNAYQLGKEIQKVNPKIRNLRQLRASVIADWLKSENMRVVQHRIGHKHITSVEKYKQEDLETLKEQLRNFHPLQ